MKSLQIVHVTWIDSETTVGWEAIDEIEHEHPLAHTVGILVCENEDAVIIAHSYDPRHKHINGRIHIPHVAIKEMRTIGRVKV